MTKKLTAKYVRSTLCFKTLSSLDFYDRSLEQKVRDYSKRLSYTVSSF